MYYLYIIRARHRWELKMLLIVRLLAGILLSLYPGFMLAHAVTADSVTIECECDDYDYNHSTSDDHFARQRTLGYCRNIENATEYYGNVVVNWYRCHSSQSRTTSFHCLGTTNGIKISGGEDLLTQSQTTILQCADN